MTRAPETSTITRAVAESQCVLSLTRIADPLFEKLTVETLLQRYRVSRKFAASALLKEQLRRSARG